MSKIDKMAFLATASAEEKEVLSELNEFAEQFTLDMNRLVNDDTEAQTRSLMLMLCITHLKWAAIAYKIFCLHDQNTATLHLFKKLAGKAFSASTVNVVPEDQQEGEY